MGNPASVSNLQRPISAHEIRMRAGTVAIALVYGLGFAGLLAFVCSPLAQLSVHGLVRQL